MSEIPLSVRMKAHIGDHQFQQTLHGHLQDGIFVYTDHSAGRVAQNQALTHWELVESVREEIIGAPVQEMRERTVQLGPGIIYEYGHLAFTNRDGVIYQLGASFDGTDGLTPVSLGTIVGGAMPNTRFEALPEPGFALV